MSFPLSVPLTVGTPLSFSVEVGQIVFVLGANGTGKSSLLLALYSANRTNGRRISAHRQTWFSSNAITLSAHERKNTEVNIMSNDSNPQSRWMDQYPTQRASIAIYDLVDAENVRARSIAAAVDEEKMDLARELSRKDAPIKVINDLLRLSNLPIEISVHEAEQVMASRDGGPKYSVSQLSDGERNALLIAADVLTAKPAKIFFIDEPERHLHRSIISPLLTLLFERRKDCAFVVSTHDIMLPLDNPDARTLLVRGCTYNGASASSWDADLVTSDKQLDDQLKRDILGGRRKLLFVEGAENSLDKPLYSLLFPKASVLAKSTCRDVERSVSGIRDAEGLHWLRAFGIVDNDRRPQGEIDELRDKGVYAVPTFSVESLYYHVDVQRRVVARQTEVTGSDPQKAIEGAKATAIAAIRPHIDRLSERVVETAIRQDLMGRLPRHADIAAAQPINITIDVPGIVAAERAQLARACDTGDLSFIIARYPVRETPALHRIATGLGFQSPAQYEGAVLKLLMDDDEALAFVQGLFGTLPVEIAEAR